MQIGRYNVLSEIARGGMGVVYRAQDAQGQVVALKLLLARHTHDVQVRKRFHAEVKALARLQHPNVVAIRDAGDYQGCPWLALDFVQGESLEERLRQGPLPIEDAVRITRQLAQALSYVHACGVLHRDLKPDNVLLRGGQALLTDFGLVLDADSSVSRLTATGVLQGTPGYWSPEQARGEIHQMGPATDVYGLGALLYASLTGQPPIQAESVQMHLLWVTLKKKTPPRALRPEVPRWLSDLCMRCLAVEPGDRPASIDEVARALVLAGADEAQARVRRLRAGMVGVVVLAACAALGSWTLWREATLLDVADGSEANGGRADGSETNSQGAGGSETNGEGEDGSETNGEDEDGSETNSQVAGGSEANGEGEDGSETNGEDEDGSSTDGAGQGGERSAEEWLKKGDADYKAGRYGEAIEALDRALELEPRYGQSTFFAHRGGSKAFLGRDAEAVEDFDRALELEPRSGGVHSSRGISRFRLGLNAEAVEDFDRALELGGITPDVEKVVRGLRGKALTKLREESGAKRWFDSGADHFRARRYAEGIEAYSKALELDPDYEAAYTSRGVCKAKLGRDAEALGDYDRALELNPRNGLAYTNRGSSKARLGHDAEAIKDYDRAVELAPGKPGTHMNRGISRFRLGLYAEAVTDLDRALELGVDEDTEAIVRRLRAQATARRAGSPIDPPR